MLTVPIRSVDRETDNLVQSIIREEFGKCALLTIAHRVHTVQDYDQVIVMADGEMLESGDPHELLARDSHFAALWREGSQQDAIALSIGEGP